MNIEYCQRQVAPSPAGAHVGIISLKVQSIVLVPQFQVLAGLCMLV